MRKLFEILGDVIGAAALFFTGWVVRVTPEGWKRLVPVGKNGRVLKGRVEQNAPYSWDRLTVTDQELAEMNT